MGKVKFKNLTGKLLIASPYTMSGNLFHKSVIYVLSHTSKGSVGLIVNNQVKRLPFKVLLKNADEIPGFMEDMSLPVYLGGPVEPERGFFLHSRDYQTDQHESLAISTSSEIIEDIIQGHGPKYAMFVVGYTGWALGQLEEEIERNLWVVDEYHEDLIFSADNEDKWRIALKNLGIDDALFASNIGHG